MARRAVCDQHSQGIVDVHARNHPQATGPLLLTVVGAPPAELTAMRDGLPSRDADETPTLGPPFESLFERDSEVGLERPTLTASPGTYGEREAVSGGQHPSRARYR